MSDRTYIGLADPYFTTADELKGYPETRKRLAGYSDDQLTRDYLDRMRDCFHDMFGHNARRFQDLLGEELIARGIRQLPNIFGPIAVNRQWVKGWTKS
jgi:hypothetical protein